MEENKNALTIKVYDIDYSFIIKNYLDESLWNKDWTLFVYKDYIFTLSLAEINTQDYELKFLIKLNRDSKYGRNWILYSTDKKISHNLKNSNIEILKKQINGAIFDIISNFEKGQITKEEAYQDLINCEETEEELLKEIAENFLDDNDVTNKDIREAYVDAYVYTNKKTDSLLNDYMSSRKYKVLTELYLIFLEVTKDDNRKELVLSKFDDEETIEIYAKIKEYIEQLDTEEYKEELEGKLESL